MVNFRKMNIFHLVIAIVLGLQLFIVTWGKDFIRKNKSTTSTFFKTGPKQITGSLIADPKLFNFSDATQWTPITNCKQQLAFKANRIKCFDQNINSAEMSVFQAGTNHLGLDIDTFEQKFIQKKLLKHPDKKYKVKFITIVIQCDFAIAPDTENINIMGDTFPIEKPSQPAHFAICARAPFGFVDSWHIHFWEKFYREQWNFDAFYVYDLGFSNALKTISQGIYVVDLNSLMIALWGSNERVLLTWAMAQNWLKVDCQIRAKANGAKWIFSPDFDEFLFPPRNHWKFTDIRTFLNQFKESEWLSVGSLPAPFFKHDFVNKSLNLHNRVEWNSETEWNGPFECLGFQNTRICPSWRGRRKVFFNVARATALPNALDIHQLWFCAYHLRENDEFGIELNAEKFPYIRHVNLSQT